MKKFVISGFLCIAMTFIALSTFASASSYWYTISSPNSNGATKSLTAANKEYTQVSVNTGAKESVTVSLYNYNVFGSIWWYLVVFGGIWYGDDQTLTYGSNRRAWWYGDTSDNRSYFIKATTAATTMDLSGYFQNYQ